MIPSETNGSNGNKIFVQTQLGQTTKQTQQETHPILEVYWQFLRRKYRSDHTRKNNLKFIKLFLRWIADTKAKNLEEITSDDTQDYKAYCLDTYKINGNVGRLNAINNFVDDFLKRPELRITAPRSVQVNKQVLSEEELECYKRCATTSLERLIVTYQIDGLLRPGEFYKLRISLHDINNQILYLDDTKTGNNSVILTPNMIKAFNEYLPHRIQPKRQDDNDMLIIVDRGSNYGLAPSPDSDFIYRHTKQIAMRAGFGRSVYPYLIKPSAITDGFNQQINPKILQRQARHKHIETTLRYDHASDQMTKEFFNRKQRQQPINEQNYENDMKVLLDKLLSEKSNLKTFKTGVDVLLPDTCKEASPLYS
jgi:site-specific recombinase XerD